MSETSETKESVITAMYRTNLLPLEMHACLTGDCDHNTSGDCLEWLKEQSQAERWMIATPEDLAAPPACGVLTEEEQAAPIATVDTLLQGVLADCNYAVASKYRRCLAALRRPRARSAKQGETVTVPVDMLWQLLCNAHLHCDSEQLFDVVKAGDAIVAEHKRQRAALAATKGE